MSIWQERREAQKAQFRANKAFAKNLSRTLGFKVEAAQPSLVAPKGGLLVAEAYLEEVLKVNPDWSAIPAGPGKKAQGPEGLEPSYLVGRLSTEFVELVRSASPESGVKMAGRVCSPGLLPVKAVTMTAKVVKTKHDGHSWVSPKALAEIATAYGVEDTKGLKLNGAHLKALFINKEGTRNPTNTDFAIDISCVKGRDVKVGDTLEIDFSKVSLHATAEEVGKINRRKWLGLQTLTWLTMPEYERLVALDKGKNSKKLVSLVRDYQACFSGDYAAPERVAAGLRSLYPARENDLGIEEEGGEVEFETFESVSNFLDSVRLGYPVRADRPEDRGALDLLIASALRKVIGGVRVTALQGWAVSMDELGRGEVSVDAEWAALTGLSIGDETVLTRSPGHGRSSLVRVKVVGMHDGAFIGVNYQDLQESLDGDSDGDLVYLIPGWQLDFDVQPCNEGIKAQAKAGNYTPLEYKSLAEAHGGMMEGSSFIGPGTAAAYRWVFNHPLVSVCGMSQDIAQIAEAVSAVAVKNAAAGSKYGVAAVKKEQKRLLGNGQRYSYAAAWIMAVTSRAGKYVTSKFDKDGAKHFYASQMLLKQSAWHTLLRQVAKPPGAIKKLCLYTHVVERAKPFIDLAAEFKPVELEQVASAAQYRKDLGRSLLIHGSNPDSVRVVQHLNDTFRAWAKSRSLADKETMRSTVQAVVNSDLKGVQYALVGIYHDAYAARKVLGKPLFINENLVDMLHELSGGQLGFPKRPAMMAWYKGDSERVDGNKIGNTIYDSIYKEKAFNPISNRDWVTGRAVAKQWRKG